MTRNPRQQPVSSSARQQRGRERSAATAARVRTAVLAIGFCFVAAMVFLIDFVLQPQRFPTRHVDVEGSLQNTHESQITDAIIAAVRDANILQVDLAQVARATQQNPWVETAQIKRRWPDTLVVYINERVLRSRWNESMWLDQNGIAVEIPGFVDHALPHLKGPAGREQEVLVQYQRWVQLLRDAGLKLIELENTKRDSWNLVAEFAQAPAAGEGPADPFQTGRFEIKFGIDNLQQKMDRFLKLYGNSLAMAAQDLLIVDLRYPDGVAIRWRERAPDFDGLVRIKRAAVGDG